MRTLIFKSGDEASQRRYALIQLAFGNSRRQNSTNDLATITDLMKSINKVGYSPEDEGDEEDRKPVDPDTVNVAEPMRRLGNDGGKVKVESAEFKILGELIDQTPWKASYAPGITDLKAFLKASPKDKAKAGEGKGEPAEE